MIKLFDDKIPSPEERKQLGVSYRKDVPLESHAQWKPLADRPNPADLLVEQGKSRVQQLLPIRYERMSASEFTFYRGGALIMASDLSNTPSTGINVQLCGDAHISNFGLFSSPEGRTVFDINDFDETAIGPWEWDIKRLAASIEICGRYRGWDKDKRKKAVKYCVKSYRRSMLEFAGMKNLDVWNAHVDFDDLYEVIKNFDNKISRKVGKTLKKAKRKNNTRAVQKLTEVVDGKLKIKSEPPLIIPLEEIADKKTGKLLIDQLAIAFKEYRKSLPLEIRRFIELYACIDAAHKVVGVGSVGTRAYIVLMQGIDNDDLIVLQIKQAEESVIERFCGKSEFVSHGERVVHGQKAIQTTSDMFLGWCHLLNEHHELTDYYVRQLWNGKGSIDLDVISYKGLKILAGICGSTLAHAHARTGDRYAIAGYLGQDNTFDKAIWKFSRRYADQNTKDYDTFMKAYKEERLF